PPAPTPTPSLHDALPISASGRGRRAGQRGPTGQGFILKRVLSTSHEQALRHAFGTDLAQSRAPFVDTIESGWWVGVPRRIPANRSEEHTSELQSRFDLVC